MKAAVKNGLKPIFCVGERLEENEAGKTESVLTRQVTACADHDYFTHGTVIAYEPVWAIGTGRAATAAQANKTIGFIRSLVYRAAGERYRR